MLFPICFGIYSERSSQNTNHQPSKRQATNMPLDWISLESFSCAKCGDGSPVGLYEDWSALRQRKNDTATANPNIVLVFLGGGLCGTPEQCQDVMYGEPFRFSSRYAPLQIQGHNILSNDSTVNPVLHNAVKLAVYYCSQDMFLGAGVMQETGIYRHGDLHFQHVLEYMVQEYQARSTTTTNGRAPQQDNDGGGGQLIALGISAGATGVLNHIPDLRTAAQRMNGINHLKVLVDSSMTSDFADLSLFDMDTVNKTRHPLCTTTTTTQATSVTNQNMHESLSNLPCCASTQCMARNGVFTPPPPVSTDLSSSNQKPVQESFLLLDSTYDVLGILFSLRDLFPSDDQDESPSKRGLSSTSLPGSSPTSSSEPWELTITSPSDFVEKNTAVVERMGSRLRATQETLFAHLPHFYNNHHNQSTCPTMEDDTRPAANVESTSSSSSRWPTLAWIMPSCLTNGFFFPALEIHQLACANLGVEGYVMQGGLLGQEHYESHCRETGFDLSMELTSALSGLRGTLWYDIALWEMATIQGRSIQEIVGLFVTEGVEAVLGPDLVTGETQRFGLLVEDCAGPNCIRDPETTAQHACQPLFEIQSTYEEVGEPLRIVWIVYVALFVLLGLVIRTKHGGRILAQILHFPATHSCFSVHKGRVGKKEPG